MEGGRSALGKPPPTLQGCCRLVICPGTGRRSRVGTMGALVNGTIPAHDRTIWASSRPLSPSSRITRACCRDSRIAAQSWPRGIEPSPPAGRVTPGFISPDGSSIARLRGVIASLAPRARWHARRLKAVPTRGPLTATRQVLPSRKRRPPLPPFTR